MERDCEFLEAEGIMDYSLLIGIHFRDDNTYDKMGLSPFLLRTGTDEYFISVCIIIDVFYRILIELRLIMLLLLGKQDSYQSEKFMRGYRFLEAELQDRDRVKSGRYVEICSGSLYSLNLSNRIIRLF